MAFDPFGSTATRYMNTATTLALGGIGLAVFTAPSSNMLEQAGGAIAIGVSIWGIGKTLMGS